MVHFEQIWMQTFRNLSWKIMTFEYPTLHFLHLQINSSVSSWLQRQNTPRSLQVCYTPTGLQLQQTHKPIHSWKARTLIAFGYHPSFPSPLSACPPPLVPRMKMKHFLCFSQCWPLTDNSGQQRAPFTSCAAG